MLVKEICITKKNHAVSKEKSDEMIKKLRKEHEKPIKGMFEFTDAQGGWLDFNYRFFPGDNPIQIRLVHGEICEIPAGIVKHLRNTRKKIRKFSMELAPSGRGVPSTYELQSRVTFTPMDI